MIRPEPEPPAGAASTIGVGMAPFGLEGSGWYWYVTAWPSPPASVESPLPDPAAWRGQHGAGAVLHGEDVLAERPARREGLVRDFIRRALDESLTTLTS